MFNKKVLRMISTLASSTCPTCRKENITLSPVDFDEFENAIDEAADASFEDEINIFDDPNVIINEPVKTDENPTEEEVIPINIDDDVVVEEAPVETKMVVDTDKLMNNDDLFNEARSSIYLIGKDEKCSHCNGPIIDGDLIQISNDGRIYHSDCKFGFGKHVLKVFTPKNGKIDAYGATWDAEDIIESGFTCAEILAKPGSKCSLSEATKLAQFLLNYLTYCDKKKALKKKDENKSNLVKIRETK